MSEESTTFQCPNCGAPVTIQGDRLQGTCEYCGVTVAVPEELRPRQEATPQVVIVQAPPTVTVDSETARQVARGVGCGAVLSVLIPMVIILGLVALFLAVPLPGLVTRTDIPGLRDLPTIPTGVPIISSILPTPTPSFARLETSFAGKGTGPGLFQDVRHIAIDGKGNVYAAEYDTLRIQKFSNAGKFVSDWTIDEKASIDAYRKRGPDGLTADADGNVYALWDQSLLKYDGASGKLLARFPLERGRLGTEMVVYRNTLLAFADTGFDDTLLWIDTTSGKVVRRVPKLLSSLSDENMFVSSMRLAVDGLGNIFVLYTFPNKHQGIYRFSPEGRYANRFSARPDPNDPSGIVDGIAVDNQSRIYTVLTWQIAVFNADGRFLQIIPGSLYENVNSGFGMDRENNIFVLNRGTGKIYKLAVTR